jgi:ABC-type Mn2+/Zn2+ transport system ATPase subunit
VLCASHDLEIVSGHVDRLVLLDRAVRADGPPREVLASAALGRAYAFPVDHEHA